MLGRKGVEMHSLLDKFDQKEVELPETMFSREIEGRVFQSIIARCLMEIDGVEPLEGGLFDSLLGRDVLDGGRGISVCQKLSDPSVDIKVEVNVAYGESIPAKAEEIQTKILEQVSALTGLHVAKVHVVFKGLIALPLEGEELYREETVAAHYDEVF